MTIEAQKAVAADKARLVSEGELLRIRLIHSRAQLGQALRPEALLHSAIEHAAGAAQNRFNALLEPGGLSTIKLGTVMPVLVTLGSFLAKRHLVKPALGAGAAAALLLAWLRRRRAKAGQPQ